MSALDDFNAYNSSMNTVPASGMYFDPTAQYNPEQYGDTNGGYAPPTNPTFYVGGDPTSPNQIMIKSVYDQNAAAQSTVNSQATAAGYVPGSNGWVADQRDQNDLVRNILYGTPLPTLGGSWNLPDGKVLNYNGQNSNYNVYQPSTDSFGQGVLDEYCNLAKFFGPAVLAGVYGPALMGAGAGAAGADAGAIAASEFGGAGLGTASELFGTGAELGAGAGLGAGAIDAATGLPSYALDASNFGTGAIDAATGLPSYAVDSSNFGSDVMPGYDSAGNWTGVDSSTGNSIFDPNTGTPIQGAIDVNGNPITGEQYGSGSGTSTNFSDTLTKLAKQLGSSPSTLSKLLGLATGAGASGTGSGTGSNSGTSSGLFDVANMLSQLYGAFNSNNRPPDPLHDYQATPMTWHHKAKGGAITGPRGKQGALGLLRGKQMGQADQVPIAGSHGEYMMDADTVSALGDGNTEAGAAKLDQMRKNIRSHKRSASVEDIPPKALSPLAYLKGVA
jgi:hypothetical protein